MVGRDSPSTGVLNQRLSVHGAGVGGGGRGYHLAQLLKAELHPLETHMLKS